MSANYDTIVEAALQLNALERCRAASLLWESVDPSRDFTSEDDGLEAMLDRREAEMDADPSLELSEEEFMAPFASRRRA
jgi:putative addiction module component (TIGR02574 family)